MPPLSFFLLSRLPLPFTSLFFRSFVYTRAHVHCTRIVVRCYLCRFREFVYWFCDLRRRTTSTYIVAVVVVVTHGLSHAPRRQITLSFRIPLNFPTEKCDASHTQVGLDGGMCAVCLCSFLIKRLSCDGRVCTFQIHCFSFIFIGVYLFSVFLIASQFLIGLEGISPYNRFAL